MDIHISVQVPVEAGEGVQYLELGLQLLVRCLMWVPGPELRSSAIAVRTLNC